MRTIENILVVCITRCAYRDKQTRPSEITKNKKNIKIQNNGRKKKLRQNDVRSRYADFNK